MSKSEVFFLVQKELCSAQINFNPYHSYHEGHSVIAEEFDELWDEIKKKSCDRSKDKLRKEAIQVAVTAIRFVIDLT